MTFQKRRVAVIGTGYVGLPAAILLAQAGHDVLGVDIDDNIVRAINEGVLHIDEDDLARVMAEPEVRANLRAASSPEPADSFIIAVPTPLDPRRKCADLGAVEAALRSITTVLEPGNLVVIESTIPPLTCRDVATPILESTGLRVGTDIHLAHCPERILPGNVFEEIVSNDRIIGSTSAEGIALSRELYASFVDGELLETDDVTAELCKLVENTYRDVNIALANEVSAVSETLGVDPETVISFSNRHPRVNVLHPGIGVGGHCIPIDPWFIKEVDPENSRLIFTARLVNEERPNQIAAKIRRAVADTPHPPRIVAVGATYKPDTYDLRESPALRIVELLRSDGYDVVVHDPITDEYADEPTLVDAARDADCVCVLVPHRVIVDQLADDRAGVLAAMRTPLIIEF